VPPAPAGVYDGLIITQACKTQQVLYMLLPDCYISKKIQIKDYYI